jgi:hypothetical protein
MEPATISYRAGHPVSRPARRVDSDNCVLETIVWPDGLQVQKASITPAAMQQPGDPGRVDT